MKRYYFFIIAFLLFSTLAQAKYCMSCGENLPDLAQFCSKCGNKQTVVNNVKDEVKGNSTYSKALTKIGKRAKKSPKRLLLKVNTFLIAKSDIYLYKNRGDEKNALKKNLFFKPRRYKMKQNSIFKVIEIVGDSCLVKSNVGTNGKTIQGWVYCEKLSSRSNWTK